MSSPIFKKALQMSNERRRQKKRRKVRRVRVSRLLILVALLATVALLSTVAGLYTAVAQNIPSLEAQTPFAAAQTTKIYADGEEPVLLAELHGVENREVVSGDHIADAMRDAVIAVEDERFWEHQGVDLLGIARALIADVRHGEIVQGGSTITQQFVKNAYISNEKTLDRKFKEATLAYQLEKRWSKDKILNQYLNIIYFGQGAYGVEAAAREYFDVPAIELTPAQAALLAAVPKSPSRYDPRVNPGAALDRRNMILNKMFQQGYLAAEDLQRALATPLELAPSKRGAGNRAPYWVEMVREQLVARYGSNTVLKGGLRVYTTLDLKKQAIAEEVIRSTFDRPGDPDAALVSIDLRTGEVVAMVGGLNFEEQKFNLATQGRRQPGSAFKPFVLATALDQGKGPATVYDSGPVTIPLSGDDWHVDSPDLGPITLAEATSRSSNGAYARLIMDLGPEEVVSTVRQLGVNTKIQPRPAIALGGLERGVTPLEMATAYGSLGTGGRRLSGSVTFDPDSGRRPITIRRVEDSSGMVMDVNRLIRTPVLDGRFAYATTQMLRGVIEHGTGRAADIGRPAAGKTGTTQRYRDAWFVGYTPDMVTAVWVGHADSQREMTDVRGRRVTGGSFPAEIWASYMKQALAGVEPTDFEEPPGVEWVEATVCAETGLVATRWCPDAAAGQFLAGMEPTRGCQEHGPAEVRVPGLVGLHVTEARRLLDDLRLEVDVRERDALDSDAGEVLSQDPEEGGLIVQGETVTLTVSSGQAPGMSVPALVGLEIQEARDRLESAGLDVTIQRQTAGEPAGKVTQQSPAAGERVPPESVVTLIVSTGPREDEDDDSSDDERGSEEPSPEGGTVQMPDLIGVKSRTAITRLQELGLSVQVTTTRIQEASQAGTVAGQSARPGALMRSGETVGLTIYAVE